MGGHVASHSNGTFIEVVGFRSAAEARAGERLSILLAAATIGRRSAERGSTEELQE